MRRLGLASALVFLAVFAGCKASSPSKVERCVMRWTKHTVTVRNKSERNPLPATAENIAAGREAFSHYCVACHGMDGQNTGVPFAESMSPPVRPREFSATKKYGRRFSLSVAFRLRVAWAIRLCIANEIQKECRQTSGREHFTHGSSTRRSRDCYLP